MRSFRRNILVTGGAGFIGSHVVRLFVNKYPDCRIINLDALTYAGNLANLSDIEKRDNYVFVKGDICDYALVQSLFSEYRLDGVIHLAAESHVDRSITDPFVFARKESADGEIKALQTLNVYSGDYGICLGQKFIAEKTNEIPAAQEILRMMDLEGTIVTADAMNCQKGTAEAVINAGGDYVLALKGNQQLFHEEVKEYFDTDVCESLRGETGHYMKTTDKEHGGMAVREYYITEDIMWFSEKEKWEGLKSIGMVHKVMKKNNGEQTEEDRYYICSIGAEAEEFERAARGHWGIENGLHWQLDFTFGDDKNTSMAKTSAKNLQTMKKIALSILRLVRDSYKISMKRIRYDLSLDFENGIEKMLSLLDINSVKSLIESNGKSSGKK